MENLIPDREQEEIHFKLMDWYREEVRREGPGDRLLSLLYHFERRDPPACHLSGTARENAYLRQLTDCCRKLQVHMREEKPYTDPKLTLERLASALGIPKRTITNALNTCLIWKFSLPVELLFGKVDFNVHPVM